MSLMKASVTSCASAKPENESQELVRVDETYLDKCLSAIMCRQRSSNSCICFVDEHQIRRYRKRSSGPPHH
eukprot:164854-Pleurochrysis_carterae.AAC.1